MLADIYRDDDVLSEAFAGDVITLNVLIPEGLELAIGNVLCDITMPCTLASKFEARIVIFHNIEYPITKVREVPFCLSLNVIEIVFLSS